ncbi:MAG: alpha/beta hydrolase [Actinomycetota bacterium]
MDTGKDRLESPVATSRLEDSSTSAWRRPSVVFSVAIALVCLHLLTGLTVRTSDRSVMARLWDSALAVGLSGIAVVWFRRSGRLVRALLALAIGAAATAAGVAITVVRVVKLGLSEFDLLGVSSLAAGIALLALGSLVILSEVRRRLVLAVPIGLLFVYYVMLPLTVAVYMTHVPTTLPSGRTPAEVGLDYRNVTLRTEDGVRLGGWYVPSDNAAAVIVLHGSGSTRSDVLDHIAVLGRAGYGVLAIDARGHGQSDGVAMDVGWFGALDVEPAVSYLAHRHDVDPGRIGVLGLSMGAGEALASAAADPRIGAVVAEGARAFSFADARALGLRGAFSLPFYLLGFTAVDLMTPAEPPIPTEEAMARIAPRPVLLISGEDRTESLLNRRYRAAAPHSTDLWEVPDTRHTRAIWTHPEEWGRRVLAFFGDALLHGTP